MELIIGIIILFIIGYCFEKFRDLLDYILEGIFGLLSGKFNDSLDEYEKRKDKSK
ncbi:TPA: hypothetical protein ACGOX8_000213 [Streptococcus suis]|nr:hypothetical protein [Streptococcus suis]